MRALSRVFSVAASAAVAASAVAQIAPTGAAVIGRDGIPVAVERIDLLQVSPNGYGGGDGPRPRGCDTLSTHTDADFSGGSFVAQAGFSQGEWLAASYTIPAASFPIKINLVECIFLTVNATQLTTTVWQIGFWEGVPSTGTLVDAFTSDDLILPHIRLGPGTAGVNVQFSVDPGDPEQIIINDNGSHKFSVGFQIVAHHQPPSNPCTTSPPTCCNAFPCTDTSGLAQSANNWLMGLNCGPFGCPANGGWASFSALPGFCRPSGDWVLRCNWQPVSCTPGVGPCCIAGACSIRTTAECASLGGTYQGDGTSCAGINCPPPPTQACCFTTGGCLNLSPANCTGAGGTPGGVGTTCANHNCNPTGACCLPDGSCIGPVTPAQCSAQNGTFRGDGTTCAGVTCPQPSGACCFGNGFCLVLTQADCTTAGGSSWHSGATCADGNGNGTADACEGPPPCPGDLDNNQLVDIADLSQLLAHYGQNSGATLSDGDTDGDGDVDLTDLSFVLSNFGRVC